MKKLLKLFLLIYAVTHAVCTESPETIAISQIVRGFYVKNSERFDFIIFGSETRKLKDFVDDVLKVTSDVSPYKLIEVKNDEERFGVEQSAILLFDDWKSYEEFHARVRLTNESPRKFNFLVYIDDWEPLQIIQDTKQSLMLHRESFIHKSSDGSINLVTYSKFQQPNCKQWNLSNVNKFSQGKWEKQEFFIEKFNNLNGCALVTFIPSYYGPYTVCDYDEGQTSRLCAGSGVEIDSIIGRNFNYTSYYNPTDQPLNETSTNEHILVVMPQRWKNNLTRTHPFAVNEMFILISKEAPYTQFEKLFLPFEIEVWICLIATMTTAVLTILIVKLAPQEVQNFVFGRGVNTPLLNFIVISFGMGMVRLPGRNFSMIMRTAYQVTLHISELWFGMIEDMEFTARIQKKPLPANNRFSARALKKDLSDGSKNAYVMNSDFYNMLYNIEEGKMDFARLEESIISDHYGFSFYSDSIMAEPFNRKVMQLTEAGISGRLAESFGAKHFYVEAPDDKVVLTLTHLGFGFYIWLGCLGVASTIFLLEIIYYKSLPTVASFVLRYFYP